MGAPELASVDGRIGPSSEASIPAADDGLRRGDGVFEVIRLYEGRPFALDEHLDRLERSAAAIELTIERESFTREIDALLEEFGSHDGQLRLVVTRAGRRIAFTEELVPHADSVSLATVTYTPTIILTGVKSLSYAANMQATRLAKGKGADEAVLVRPDGVVLEAPTSTLFWAGEDGRLVTPSIDSGILASITRQRLVRDLEVEEGEFQLEELMAAEEAFLASTTREVQPVSAIDGSALPAAPGPRTDEAIRAFREVLDAELTSPSTTA